jgi:signal transduction histidine kinase
MSLPNTTSATYATPDAANSRKTSRSTANLRFRTETDDRSSVATSPFSVVSLRAELDIVALRPQGESRRQLLPRSTEAANSRFRYVLRVRRWRDRLIDIGPTIVIGGIGLAEIAGAGFGSSFPGPRPAQVAFLLAATVPLALRQRWPFVVFGWVGIVTAVWEALFFRSRQPQPPLEAFLAIIVVAYTLGAHSRGRSFWIAVAMVIAGIAADPLTGGTPENDLAAWIFITAAFAIGVGVGRQRDLAASLRDAVERLEIEREERARLAVELERSRIARELHDVVAHAISVMVVQAAAERRVLGAGAGATAEVLKTIEGIGREALGETRAILGILRQDGSSPPLAPQPGLGDLPGLVDQLRSTGLRVDVETSGEAEALPPGLDLTAYRIVQEALTNVLKHAPGARANVRVVFGNNQLELRVNDDGQTAAPIIAGGHGLIGIRERVTMHGGRFSAGPSGDRGFEVTASLPIRAT